MLIFAQRCDLYRDFVFKTARSMYAFMSKQLPSVSLRAMVCTSVLVHQLFKVVSVVFFYIPTKYILIVPLCIITSSNSVRRKLQQLPQVKPRWKVFLSHRLSPDCSQISLSTHSAMRASLVSDPCGFLILMLTITDYRHSIPCCWNLLFLTLVAILIPLKIVISRRCFKVT